MAVVDALMAANKSSMVHLGESTEDKHKEAKEARVASAKRDREVRAESAKQKKDFGPRPGTANSGTQTEPDLDDLPLAETLDDGPHEHEGGASGDGRREAMAVSTFPRIDDTMAPLVNLPPRDVHAVGGGVVDASNFPVAPDDGYTDDGWKRAARLARKKAHEKYRHNVHICDVDKPEEKGALTPIHMATMLGRKDLVEVLVVEGGADPMPDDTDRGVSALIVAIERGHLSLIRYYIEELRISFDFSRYVNRGIDPIELCYNNGHEKCSKYLEFLTVRAPYVWRFARCCFGLFHW